MSRSEKYWIPFRTRRLMAAKHKYDERIFRNLESFSRVQFALLKIGPLCNATKSRFFTEADCDFQRVRDGDTPISANFSLVFQPGLSFLKAVRDGKRQNLSIREENALQKLDGYLKLLDYHEKCLKKVLGRQQASRKEVAEIRPVAEAEVTVALAEHLLGKLAPGSFHISVGKVKGEGTCQCGCKQRPNYSSTGIGHEDVWHGYTDIVFSSNAGIPESIATVQVPPLSDDILDSASPMKRPRIEDEESNIISTSGQISSAARVEDQAIAQTIIFSLLQKQRCPKSHQLLIPNIVISPTSFQIFMYDAVDDILLGSCPLQLFDVETESLRIESVIILWMVLHYCEFCEGIKLEALTDDFIDTDIRSHFRERAESKWDVYSTILTKNVAHFSPTKKRTTLTYADNWFAKELTYKDMKN